MNHVLWTFPKNYSSDLVSNIIKDLCSSLELEILKQRMEMMSCVKKRTKNFNDWVTVRIAFHMLSWLVKPASFESFG